MTTFVFVHGRGRHGPDLTDWRRPVADRLVDAGIAPPALDGERWLELRYDDILNASNFDEPLPWPARPSVPQAALDEFEQRREQLLQHVVTPPRRGPFDALNRGVDAAVTMLLGRCGIPVRIDLQGLIIEAMEDVERFATDERLRRAVVHRLLERLPDGDVVLVAHSLGSVAVLEMLPYLPESVHVKLLVTLGSPAALDRLQSRTNLAGRDAPFPADRVDLWLNLVNVGDPISLGAGLREKFPLVVDHRVRDRRSVDGAIYHGVRTYLTDPALARALEISLSFDRAPVPYEGQQANADPDLPSYLTVLFAQLLGDAADDGGHRQRARLVLSEKLLPALSSAVGAAVTANDVELKVGGWVAKGQPREHRLLVLLSAALSDPFAPFELGLTQDDRKRGLRLLATRLGLTHEDAEDLRALVDRCRAIAANSRKPNPWVKVAVGISVIASAALAAPLAVGALAASGAAGAAAMTSGLAALGTGGMVGGLSTVAALAAGVGVVGGRAGGATSQGMLQDEVAMTEDLARRAATIRLLRGIDDESTQVAARRGFEELGEIDREVQGYCDDHDRMSSSRSQARAVAERNRKRVVAVRVWLDEKASADRERAGLSDPPALPLRAT